MYFERAVFDAAKRSLSISVLLLLAGCGSLLSSAGPGSAAITSNSESGAYELVDISSSTIGKYMRPSPREMAGNIALPQVSEVRLLPGDVLKILVADSAAEGAVFAPLSGGGTTFSNVRIDSKGTISFPYAGRTKVEGMTISEVQDAIVKKLRGVTTDPQVQVELTGDISGSVLVVGAVKTPGRFSALQGPLTLLDAINMAGGPVLEPHLIRVVVRTGKAAYHFNYEDLLTGKNQVVPPKSEITVERARRRFVAMGAVGQPGLHDLPSSNPSLLEVLGAAGWLSESKADASGVFIFRMGEYDANSDQPHRSPPQVFRLNMKDPAAVFLARQFLVEPEDAVYVTNAAVYEWQKIISPIVQVLVLGRMAETF